MRIWKLNGRLKLMRANDLVGMLAQQTSRAGNLRVMLQSDGEGNAYDYARGAAIAYATSDLETTFDTLADAEEYGFDEDYLQKVIVIYP